MASTVKLPLAAALLWQVDHGAFPLATLCRSARRTCCRTRRWSSQLIAQGGGEMTVRDLCIAAVTYSDNAAANVLLQGLAVPRR